MTKAERNVSWKFRTDESFCTSNTSYKTPTPHLRWRRRFVAISINYFLVTNHFTAHRLSGGVSAKICQKNQYALFSICFVFLTFFLIDYALHCTFLSRTTHDLPLFYYCRQCHMLLDRSDVTVISSSTRLRALVLHHCCPSLIQ